jgi:hypothetical protein
MFEVTIVSSADPALKVLRSRPDQIFGKPFCGYAIFLFSAADEEIATWFSRQLVALDSVSGDDVALIVFASRIRISATVSRTPRPDGRGGGPRIEHGTVQLHDVKPAYGNSRLRQAAGRAGAQSLAPRRRATDCNNIRN